ncbi:alpha/beta fold hydrolase [Myxococcus sp. AM001]|nr:alpha/beta fold hydrolase [Myxococcus sp. AM001]
MSSPLPYSGSEYWKNYLLRWYGGEETLRQWTRHVRESTYRGQNRSHALDLYPGASPERPVIILVPGSVSYGRLFAYPALLLRERGYNVITFDFEGCGLDRHGLGDYTLEAHVRNLVDVIQRARQEFRGPVVTFGLSFGGMTSYLAAERTPVDAMAWYACVDPSDREFIQTEFSPGKAMPLVVSAFRGLAKLLPRVRVPVKAFLQYSRLSDSVEFNEAYGKDPLVGGSCTLRAMVSVMSDYRKSVPFGDVRYPFLVMHDQNDRMFPMKYSRKTYEQLGDIPKAYVELSGQGHWPTTPEGMKALVAPLDTFLQGLPLGARAVGA